MNEHVDALGNDIAVGDYIEFDKAGITIYGQVQRITDDEKPKYMVRTLGFRGDKALGTKVKDTYKIDAALKNIYKINWKSDKEEELRNRGLLI